MKSSTRSYLPQFFLLFILVLSLLPFVEFPSFTYIFGSLFLGLAIYAQSVIWRVTNAQEISQSIARNEKSGALFFGTSVSPEDLIDQSSLVAERRKSLERSKMFAAACGIFPLVLVVFVPNLFSPYSLIYAIYSMIIIKYRRPHGYRVVLSFSLLICIFSFCLGDRSNPAFRNADFVVWFALYVIALAFFGGDLLGIRQESLKFLRSTSAGRMRLFQRAFRYLLVIGLVLSVLTQIIPKYPSRRRASAGAASPQDISMARTNDNGSLGTGTHFGSAGNHELRGEGGAISMSNAVPVGSTAALSNGQNSPNFGDRENVVRQLNSDRKGNLPRLNERSSAGRDSFDSNEKGLGATRTEIDAVSAGDINGDGRGRSRGWVPRSGTGGGAGSRSSSQGSRTPNGLPDSFDANGFKLVENGEPPSLADRSPPTLGPGESYSQISEQYRNGTQTTNNLPKPEALQASNNNNNNNNRPTQGPGNSFSKERLPSTSKAQRAPLTPTDSVLHSDGSEGSRTGVEKMAASDGALVQSGGGSEQRKSGSKASLAADSNSSLHQRITEELRGLKLAKLFAKLSFLWPLFIAAVIVFLGILFVRRRKQGARKKRARDLSISDETIKNFVNYFRIMYRNKMSPEDEVLKIYYGLEKLFEEIKHPRQEFTPPVHFSVEISGHLPQIADSFRRITLEFCLVLYGKNRPSTNSIKEVRLSLNSILEELGCV